MSGDALAARVHAVIESAQFSVIAFWRQTKSERARYVDNMLQRVLRCMRAMRRYDDDARRMALLCYEALYALREGLRVSRERVVRPLHGARVIYMALRYAASLGMSYAY